MKQTAMVLVGVLALATGFVAGRWSVVSAAAPQAVASPPQAQAAPHPMMGGQGGFLPKAAPVEVQVVEGKVLEVIQVPTYTYARLQTAQGEAWAAVESNAALKAGDSMVVEGATLMENFSSKTLNRTFAQIYFGRQSGFVAPQ